MGDHVGDPAILAEETRRAKVALWTTLFEAATLGEQAKTKPEFLFAAEAAFEALIATVRAHERAVADSEREAFKSYVEELEQNKDGAIKIIRAEAAKRDKARDLVRRLVEEIGPGHAFTCKPYLRGRCVCGRTALLAEAHEVIYGP